MKSFVWFLFVLILSASVFGLGVAPAKITLDEGTDEFKFKIFNNEGLNTTVVLTLKGDDFIDLDNDLIDLTSDLQDVIVTAKIKDKDYNSSRFASIHLSELRQGDAQINVNLGVSVPVTLKIFGEDALLDAQITTPAPSKYAKGPYLVSVKNLGLQDVSDASATLVVAGERLTKSFNIEGRASEDLIFTFDDSLKQGFHDVELTIDYDGRKTALKTIVQAGTPYINISDLKVKDYTDDLLEFEIQLFSDWPEQINNSRLYIKTSAQEYESETFSMHIEEQKSISMIIRAPSDNFTMDVYANNQKPIEYTVDIIDGKVFIDGEYDQNDRLNYLLLLFVFLMIAIIIVIRTKSKELKLKNKK